MTQTLFHPGELAAQALAGVVSRTPPIRDWMPDQHRAFFGLLPFLPIATAGADGAPAATILTGPPGFIASPDPTTLHIAARPDRADPAAPFFLPGAPVGLLGIDLATRRRNRANGILRSSDPDGLTISVTQSFGNCPQYIQTRLWQDGAATPALPVEYLTGLDPAARSLIANADTFFVATNSGGGAGSMGGMDISHRGGRPGFVGIAGDTLTIPDFHGNGYFNTLGNLLLDPRVALLFVDWTDGTVLHLRGTVEILWNQDGGLDGAERLWRISITDGWRRRGALPLRWSFQTYAPQTLRTGVWNAIQDDRDGGIPWPPAVADPLSPGF
ncbi:pyridoxamine 5'-phosphate oxidase family protein [Acidisphaera sp. S103]|uniref:pyridoxamine 5'-phosphate oxidase family protein n=1 Tax=Acidisphaera sp. S103 TaxID=1747223 RepID=UPI00131D7559|nr:pyridoxamine 5'-phosphate oxidase family protein [Acidisphaera sp. S103]